jgi:sec-independent protein translocase protein TatC
MSHPPEEDLFRDSTMSFGEHLDELRSALFKAVFAIAVGFGIGLLCANWVVERVKQPLVTALERYYSEQATDEFLARIAEREANGETIPPELKDPAYVEQLVNGDQLLFDEVYLDPAALVEALRRQHPGLVKDLPKLQPNTEGPPQKSDLVRMFLWHTVKDDLRVRVVALSSQEVFVIWMQAALVSGIVFASPAAFYFLWSFVAAGLYPQEKKYVFIFLPFSLGLFLLGVGLAFFFVFPPVLSFFFSFNRVTGIDPDPRISEWISLVLMLPLAFGISFQLPLIMLFIERIGIVTIDTYIKQWRMAILIMAVGGMVLTPTGDPQSLLMLLGPLIVLYFAGIGLCKWMPRAPQKTM